MTTHPNIPTDELERLAEQIKEIVWHAFPDVKAGASICTTYLRNAEVADANARLIAIAPALLRELIARRKADEWQPTHRHVKRGTEYREVARGKLQTDTPLTDYAELVAYHDHDGNWWFRAPSEFDDGRFTTLTAGDIHDD